MLDSQVLVEKVQAEHGGKWFDGDGAAGEGPQGRIVTHRWAQASMIHGQQ